MMKIYSYRHKALKFFLAVVFFSAVFALDQQALAAPSTVGTSADSGAISDSFQRKSFFAQGRFWAFYSDGINMVYKTSLDGSSWSSATVVRPAISGQTFSVFFDEPFFDYAYASGQNNIIYYRRGWANSDGTVTWITAEQSIVVGSGEDRVTLPVITLAEAAYPWIGFKFVDASEGWQLPMVTRSSVNNGTWSTAVGFPYQLSGTLDTFLRVLPVPLTGGQVYVLWKDYYNNGFWGRLWNGSSFEAQETIPRTSPFYVQYFSAVGYNNDVHVVYYESTDTIVYAKRTFGAPVPWGFTYLYSGPPFSAAPVLSVNKANGDLYAFWAGSPQVGRIYYKKYAGGNWDANPTDWLTDNFGAGSNDTLTGFYQAYGNNIGLMYMTGSNPYNIRFNALVLPSPPTVTTDPATLVEETTATLNGNITSTGEENPTRYFDWDTDSGVPYANQVNAGVGGAGLYSGNLTNLSKGILYYFRARAVNSVGTGNGSELSFLTKPDEPTNFTATPISAQIALSWVKGTGANRIMVRRSTTGYPATITDGTQVYFNTGTSYTDTGLTNGTTYYYSAWSEITTVGLTQYSDVRATVSTAPIAPPVCQSHNVFGYAWSENIGWISASCENTAALGTGTNFGLDINSGTGLFFGYAWSENIGWIDFAPTGPYPALPNYPACVDFPGAGQACDNIGNYNVAGWARALSYSDSWDGWIKLRGTNYGVSFDSGTGDFAGFAWSDAVIGWINFAGANYKVRTTLIFNSPPDKPTTLETDWNRCSFRGGVVPIFNWTYSDPNGDPQTAYEIEVDDNSSFNAPKFNHLVNSPSTSYALDLSQDDDPPDPGGDWISQLAWNSTYFWHVRVKDSFGNWSEWSNSNQSKTDKHASPWVDFTWIPSEPTQKETVEFADLTETSGGSTIVSRLWTIISGTGVFVDGTDNTTSSPHIQFSTTNNTVQLEVTDSDGYSCYEDKDVIVQLPLPEYKEVVPLIRLLTQFSKFAILFKDVKY